jgi:tetratricopeptide (TPR) repeat protein
VAALAAPPSQALIEKLGAGDRAFLARDYRGALFLYQDAIYMAPASVPARIRLARCYAALRYPAQAEAQLTQALELDPASGEARKLLDELRALPPPPLPVGPGVVQAPGAGRPPVEPPGAGAGTAAPVAPPAVLGSGSTGTLYRLAPEAPGPSPASRQAAAELYRAAVAQIAQRDFAAAADGLTRALALDPSLALAYEARASARFGLGQHQEAARDYQTAAALSADRASPLWGLAECYRLLGDPRAAETYERFAASPAPDATEPLREQARRRAQELRRP